MDNQAFRYYNINITNFCVYKINLTRHPLIFKMRSLLNNWTHIKLGCNYSIINRITELLKLYSHTLDCPLSPQNWIQKDGLKCSVSRASLRGLWGSALAPQRSAYPASLRHASAAASQHAEIQGKSCLFLWHFSHTHTSNGSDLRNSCIELLNIPKFP